MFDPFGFNKAIQTDHLTDEEVDLVNDMFTRAEARRNSR